MVLDMPACCFDDSSASIILVGYFLNQPTNVSKLNTAGTFEEVDSSTLVETRPFGLLRTSVAFKHRGTTVVHTALF